MPCKSSSIPLSLISLLYLAACGSPGGPVALPIGEVQGSAARSDYIDQRVAVEGVVVGGTVEGLGGVFVQDPEGDGDPATSEGIFVELASGTPSPDRFQRIRVVGTVVELGNGPRTLTALSQAQVAPLTGTAEIEPAQLVEPPEGGDWERYEGMLVAVSAPLSVSGTGNITRYGEIIASFGDRLYAPTEVARPGPDAEAEARENQRRRLTLDDADIRQRDELPWYLPEAPSADRPLRVGSSLSGATGIIDQRFGEYRLQLTSPIGDGIEQAPRPDPPPATGDLRLVAFNVLNLFNGDGRGGGFPTPRGARTADEYALQQAKLVAALQAMAPDIAALMEIENDGSGPESALAHLVDALNAAGPATDYRYVDVALGPGSDEIRVALIYRGTRVRPVGAPVALEGGPFARLSRVPLGQAFQAQGAPALFVVANHFKSKNCGRDEEAATGGDADQGDGQSCWNAARTESARRLAEWVGSNPTGTGTELTALLGDFNAYAQEDPMRLLREAGWRDALAEADVERPYSSVYSRTGEAGRLDHALLTPSLAAYLRSAQIWHSNVDELEIFGYRDGGDGSPYRASDHDPLILDFELGAGR